MMELHASVSSAKCLSKKMMTGNGVSTFRASKTRLIMARRGGSGSTRNSLKRSLIYISEQLHASRAAHHFTSRWYAPRLQQLRGEIIRQGFRYSLGTSGNPWNLFPSSLHTVVLVLHFLFSAAFSVWRNRYRWCGGEV